SGAEGTARAGRGQDGFTPSYNGRSENDNEGRSPAGCGCSEPPHPSRRGRSGLTPLASLLPPRGERGCHRATDEQHEVGWPTRWRFRSATREGLVNTSPPRGGSGARGSAKRLCRETGEGVA